MGVCPPLGAKAFGSDYLGTAMGVKEAADGVNMVCGPVCN